MKKLVAAVLLGLALSAAIVVVGFNKADERSANNATTTQPATGVTDQAAAGAYTDYDSVDLAKISGTKILFFHAAWCPQCRALEADIKQKGVPSGVTIVKVDYDTNQALRQKYGVTLQTTLVKIDDNGNLIKKYVAYDEPNLEAVKKNLL